jgi:S-adenosylmethionine hydrolase
MHKQDVVIGTWLNICGDNTIINITHLIAAYNIYHSTYKLIRQYPGILASSTLR